MSDNCLQVFCDEKGSWPCDKTFGHEDLHFCRKKINKTDSVYREWNAFGKTQPAQYMGRLDLTYPTPTIDIQKSIKGVLVPDAIKTLYRYDIDVLNDPVIEIRAKLTHLKGEKIPGISSRWGIAWMYMLPYMKDLKGFETYTMAQEPLFNFDGEMREDPLGGYLLLARLTL